jgi:hypothetical protein
MLLTKDFIAYLQAIFYCLQIPQGPSALVPRQTPEEYDQYYYLPQSPTATVLLNDSLNYLLQCQAQAGPRQVVFLPEPFDQEPGALILRFSQWDSQYANQLRTRLAKLSTTEREQLLSDQQSATLFHPLYHRVECCLMGSAAIKSVLRHWLSLLRQTYGQPEVTYQPLECANHQEIVWSNGLQQWLTHGKLKAIDIQQAAQEQLQLFLTTFRHQWLRIQAQEPVLYRAIADQLGILLKYAWLQANRQQIKLPATLTRAQLQIIQSQDWQWKQQIYQTTFTDITHYFELLNRQTLVQLILHLHPSQLLAYLQSEQQRQRALLQDWETLLVNRINESSSWLEWGYHTLKQLLLSLYQHSPVNTSVHLAQWGAEQLTAFGHSSRTRRLKQLTLTVIEAMTFGLTWSPRLAQSSRAKAERWLNYAGVIFLSKAIGSGAGLGYSYFAGSYAVTKWILTSFVSRWLYQRFNQPQLDEEQARVRAGRELLSATSYAQATHLTVAAIETAITRDYRYLLQALGGTISSTSAVTLCQKLAGNFPETVEVSTEENKIIARFFMTLISYDLGQRIADHAFQWHEQLTLCQSASEAFNKLANAQSWVAWQAQCPTLVDGFSIFRSAKKLLQLNWITLAGDYHETECQVLKYNSTLGQAVCERPTIASSLRLAR